MRFILVSLLLLAIASAPSIVLGENNIDSSLVEAGQHVIWSYPGLTPPQSLYDSISAGHVAGIIFFKGNTGTNISDVVASFNAANEASPTKLPLLLMTDQEGGAVRRLPGEPVKNAKQMCSDGTAGAGGTGAGENLRSVGMNMNLAPVLDVYRTSGNFIDQYGRSFSNNMTTVGICGTEFMEAQRAAGVISTVKHFPGLGAAPAGQNTDLTAVTLNLTLSEIRSVDEQPYCAAIDAGAEVVMASWAVYPALDPNLPAGFSSEIIRSELRGRLKFEGVTITDAIEAGSLSLFGDNGDRAILASQAGMDLLLASARNVTQGSDIVRALANALDNGTLDTKAFKDATERIKKLRESLA
ncbi:hypothetical protein C0995_016316 [Termitomyces sp. Mi166|nr:hypothetical protein C0995_016316 [Termitomyces sp. Mi166\